MKCLMKILILVMVEVVEYNMEITIKDTEEYAKYYYSVKTLLKQKPLTFKEWQQSQ